MFTDRANSTSSRFVISIVTKRTGSEFSRVRLRSHRSFPTSRGYKVEVTSLRRPVTISNTLSLNASESSSRTSVFIAFIIVRTRFTNSLFACYLRMVYICGVCACRCYSCYFTSVSSRRTFVEDLLVREQALVSRRTVMIVSRFQSIRTIR